MNSREATPFNEFSDVNATVWCRHPHNSVNLDGQSTEFRDNPHIPALTPKIESFKQEQIFVYWGHFEGPSSLESAFILLCG